MAELGVASLHLTDHEGRTTTLTPRETDLPGLLADIAAKTPPDTPDANSPTLHAPSLGLTIQIRPDGFRWTAETDQIADMFSARLDQA